MNVAIFLEIRNEYTEHLVDAISPYIYEGLMTIYHQAVQAADETNSTEKTLLIFQRLLQTVSDWNQKRIEDETNRIKQASGTNEYMDDLVKAVVRSNIILLTYPNFNQYLAHTFMNTITTATFIHCCYVECSKTAHNFPNLFYHNVEPMDQKRNQMSIQNNIQDAIIRSIRKILPIHAILKEYLVNSSQLMCDPYGVELVGGAPQRIREEHRLTPANPLPFQEKMQQFREPVLSHQNRAEPMFQDSKIQQFGALAASNPIRTNQLSNRNESYLSRELTDRNIDSKYGALDRVVENIIRSENSKRDQVKDLLRIDNILSAKGENRISDRGKRGRLNERVSEQSVSEKRGDKRVSEQRVDKRVNEKIVSEKSERGGSLEIDMSKNFPEYGNRRFQNRQPLLPPRNVVNPRHSEKVSDFMNRNLDETDKALFDLKFDTLDDQTTQQESARYDNLTSEKPDPSKVTIIEDYGTKKGNAKNRPPNRH